MRVVHVASWPSVMNGSEGTDTMDREDDVRRFEQDLDQRSTELQRFWRERIDTLHRRNRDAITGDHVARGVSGSSSEHAALSQLDEERARLESLLGSLGHAELAVFGQLIPPEWVLRPEIARIVAALRQR